LDFQTSSGCEFTVRISEKRAPLGKAYEDSLAHAGSEIPYRHLEGFPVDSWAEHQRQHDRFTMADWQVEDELKQFLPGPAKGEHSFMRQRDNAARLAILVRRGAMSGHLLNMNAIEYWNRLKTLVARF
jgi:hypothetical protein